MSGADWFVTAFVLVSGVGIMGFWTWALLANKAETLGDFGESRTFHVGAEVVTAVLLIVAGMMRIAKSSREHTLTALALGALIYAAIQSPGYYLRKAPAIAWLLAATGLATLLAVAIVLKAS